MKPRGPAAERDRAVAAQGWGSRLLAAALSPPLSVGLVIVLVLLQPALAAGGERGGPSEVLFLSQIILLLLVGRLLGEAMQRVGQPAVMGQLIGGILLGPSVFGAIWPEGQHAVFPSSPEQKSMINAVSQLGVLMLLLLTGMETDLSLVRRVRRAAFSVSVAGIAVPFACGFLLGEMLPDWMLPHPEQRLVTSLFLGTALSISSVKIVAMVVREMHFMRRNVGQVIVASAIIDDTIGWIIIAITFGIALHGGIDPASLAMSVIGTGLFLVLSLTIGRRIVSVLIRWTNDNFVSEVPVITMILIVMGLMALLTNWIGVHTVLGAFVAGILVGQSPILTQHIEEQLRGLITALFMPVFFGLAGLTADLTVLADPTLLLLSIGLILIASLGKFGGAFIGGTAGGLSRAESFALACGMNARGSTEVIVASIGLSMGALSQNLFTMIVAMAVVTTMAMPPMLRWALARLPLSDEERERLEREAFEAKGFVPNLERLLLAVDESPNGRFASRLAGLLAGSRRIPITVLHLAKEETPPAVPSSFIPSIPGIGAPEMANAGLAASTEEIKAAADTAVGMAGEGSELAAVPLDVTTRVQAASPELAVAEESRKGYDLLAIGLDGVAGADGIFTEEVARIAAGFDGPLAVVAARGAHQESARGVGLNILVPVTGTEVSRRAAEVALVLARANDGQVTALHVASAAADAPRRRGLRARMVLGRNEEAILRDIVGLADQYRIPIRTAVRTSSAAETAILRQVQRKGHDLIVMGVTRRPGETLFFGNVAAAVLQGSDRSILFVAS